MGVTVLLFNINTRRLTPTNGPLYPIYDGFMAKRGNLNLLIKEIEWTASADILLCNVDEDEFWNLEREFKRTRGDYDYKRKYSDNFDFEYNPDIVMKE